MIRPKGKYSDAKGKKTTHMMSRKPVNEDCERAEGDEQVDLGGEDHDLDALGHGVPHVYRKRRILRATGRRSHGGIGTAKGMLRPGQRFRCEKALILKLSIHCSYLNNKNKTIRVSVAPK